MIPSPEPWLAGFVHRWHAGSSAPWLAQTGDRVDGHGGRMAVLALTMWADCSRNLLAACVTHDLGEYVAGDLPWSEDRDAEMTAASDRVQSDALADMGLVVPMSGDDQARLKFLDRLDAYLWAQHHAPQLMVRPEWIKAHRWLVDQAEILGIAMLQSRM